MTSVAIIDYGAGNLDSVRKAVLYAGAEATIATTPEQVLAADRLILPGVGAAGEAIARLRRAGLDEALTDAVRKRARPFMGICLGMQLLAERLHEFGEHAGLGWIGGEAVSLRTMVPDHMRVPHMGWNRVESTDQGEELFSLVRGRREFYFAHSFALSLNGDGAVLAATTEYGGAAVVAAIRKDTIFATQFHPEKSQISGDQLLGAFLEWAP